MTKLIHIGDEAHLIYIARVSSNQENTDPKLLSFLIRQNHWSPFEMIGACVEIETTRDIGRQILRHRSFAFQEFSQRYAPVKGERLAARAMRIKGSTNRQGSLDGRDTAAERVVYDHVERSFALYQALLREGVAPECARSVLPEGFAPTKLYMNGTLRSWIHYLRERCKLDPNENPYAQREHYWLAREIETLLRGAFPITFAALDDMGYIDRELSVERQPRTSDMMNVVEAERGA